MSLLYLPSFLSSLLRTSQVSKTDDSFRLPFGWQYMVGNNQASTSLDPTFLSKYDTLVQGVLKSGGYALLDLHNYARWNGGIVGQGGPSNENVSEIIFAFEGRWLTIAC